MSIEHVREHFEKSVELMEKVEGGKLGREPKDVVIAKAQVHATLALAAANYTPEPPPVPPGQATSRPKGTIRDRR